MRSKGLQLVIAGAPASGKGTQCELIRDKYNLVHLSTGDMLRAAKDQGTEIGLLAKGYMDKGALVPDDVIIGAVKERLAQADCLERGWLLDGFPRTRAQADALAAANIIVDCFVFLDVPDSMIVDRVVGRRLDPVTGIIYHMKFNPPPADVLKRVTQRDDDTETNVVPRLHNFHKNLAPILDAFKQVLFRVDGSGNKTNIFNRITPRIDAIKRYSVVFVLGGPGTGKGTLCAKIVAEFGYTHLSAGDLLREEQNSGSDKADMINTYIKEGKIVPVEVTVNLILSAMEASGRRSFLIDGFPRSLDNLEGWFKVMGDQADISMALFLDCPQEEMMLRLLDRGKTSGRADDNEETIKKRFTTFLETSMPVLSALEKFGKVRKVSTVPPNPVVVSRVRKLFRGMALLPPAERTLAVIKPAVVSAGQTEEVLAAIEAKGFCVVGRKSMTLSKAQAEVLCVQAVDGNVQVKTLTSGPVEVACLQKVAAIASFLKLMGPPDVAAARAADPSCLRAKYSTGNTENAIHGSANTGAAIKEISLCFPEGFRAEQTIGLIKPVTAELNAESILDIAASQGLEVVKLSQFVPTRLQASEFYASATGKPADTIAAVDLLSSSPSVMLLLEGGSAVSTWRHLVGPADVTTAKDTRPDSLRAMYGVDAVKNGLHASFDAVSATREKLLWFPEEQRHVSGQGSEHQEQMLTYLKEKVDVIFAPLLQRILIKRPTDVAKFTVDDLSGATGAGIKGGRGG